jgi:hypothetical protein
MSVPSSRPLHFCRQRRQTINPIILVLGWLVLVIQLSSVASAQGKLGKIGSSVRKQKAAKPTDREQSKPQAKTRQRANNRQPDNHDHDDSPNLGGKLAGIAVAVSPSRPKKKSVNQGQHSHGNSNHHRRDSNRNQSRNRRRRGHRPSFRPPTFIVADPFVPIGQSCGLPPVTVVEPVFVPQPVIVQEPVIVHESVIVREPAIVDETIIVSENDVVIPVGADWFQDSNSKLWATIGNDFDDISSGSFGLLFQAKRGLGLQLSLGTLRESGADFRDHLWLGDANLVYQFVNRSNFKASVGGGLNWLSTTSTYGDWNADAGVNLKFKADLRLTERLTASADSNWGTIGQADYTRTRVSLNRRFDSVDLLIGAEHLSIGGTEINSAFTGFQLRF